MDHYMDDDELREYMTGWLQIAAEAEDVEMLRFITTVAHRLSLDKPPYTNGGIKFNNKCTFGDN